ncbi:hypothetical protein [Alkalicoccus daliensis]|uniref:Uncharacterized protein n=1 Tax=Alkalicoccus daliensis TaxID=745820 RepID=A0A1H0HTH8_9BACI|nr:hypothetical protein [Alkalicoccus daliensis]SDO22443.1 hypothetical protein SAMN04488053_10934 [Alkalicoccus daliensis]
MKRFFIFTLLFSFICAGTVNAASGNSVIEPADLPYEDVFEPMDLPYED